MINNSKDRSAVIIAVGNAQSLPVSELNCSEAYLNKLEQEKFIEIRRNRVYLDRKGLTEYDNLLSSSV